ncbi:hypothetical protein EDE15_2917 [Edaphobacter aggregans]|jgi:hypothetical protein|uniref:Parallel beta helix pectate lyase-like protein n=1 Tax=Edaphobacter aggregans TaxID=570835 RepID=A0A428MKC3_9BACT|nr:hypothetical protein [Edaphobacter aggregans]RSL17385.1 hypothetical protein EDE15_2917 [Edaphobacter aggregans]
MSKVLSAIALFVFVFLAVKPSFATGGKCPSGNTTIDPSGNPINIADIGVNGTITGGITSCFYASQATGSDTNSGTTEASPWKHIPGMSGCSGVCASTIPVAGEAFILKGGDTWTATTDMNGLQWAWSGTSTHPIAVSTDPTWFNSSCGASWCRPIFNANSAATNNMFNVGKQSWNIFDNIEVTGMRNNINGCQMASSTNTRCTQLYFHGWSHTGNSDNVGFFAQCGTADMIDHNVIDGSDSTKNTFNGVFSSCAGTIAYNYFAYVVSGVLASTDSVHDNTILHTVTSIDGDHCNALFTFGPASGTSQLIYNNYINNGNSCPGGVVLWFNGNGGGSSSWVGYGFNNVMWGLSSNPVNVGNHQTTNYGTYYWFNNTVDCALGGCGGTPGNGYWTMFDQNNHAIPSALNFDATSFGGSIPTPCNLGKGTGCTDLTQTEAVANGQGYMSTEAHPYSPIGNCTPSTCGTVQSGTNLTSTYCSTLSSVDAAAGAACLSSSSVGVAYNSTSHKVTGPSATPLPRPSSGPWDIGAYQLGIQGGPSAPTSLTGAVQ